MAQNPIKRVQVLTGRASPVQRLTAVFRQFRCAADCQVTNVIACYHRGFTKNAFCTEAIFFRHIIG